MTNIKTGIFALATILGIGSAFTTAPKTPTKRVGATYFARSTGSGHFAWSTTQPDTRCVALSTPAYCTIVTNGTGYVPINDMAPDLTKSSTADPNSRYDQ